MDIQDMMAAVTYSNTSLTILNQIGEEPYWRQELDSFVNIIKGCKVASFYETELTKRLIKVCIFSSAERLLAEWLLIIITETRRLVCARRRASPSSASRQSYSRSAR